MTTKLRQEIEKSRDTFLEQLDNTKVVLLHPDSRYRSMLVAHMVNDPDIKTFYYAMGPDDIDVESLLSGITHDLASQHPTFGRHINTLPSAIYHDLETNLTQILETFAQDLAELHDQRYILLLDEYDRTDIADDVQRFFEKLSAHMPDHCRLVINSRTLPRLPWISLIARNLAALIKDDTLVRQNFYDIPNDYDGNLEIYALGPGFVLLDNEFIDAWEGHLPRLLFFFALDRPVVTRSDICHAFWPDLNAEQAVNVFHVTKRRLHKALDVDVLIHDEGSYRVNPDLKIYYDVAEFAKALMVGRDVTKPLDERLAAWDLAIKFYRGPFLQGHDDRWIQERRAEYSAGYIEALSNMAEYWKAQDRLEPALTLYLRALEENFMIESIQREVMSLFFTLGRRNEAVAQYQQLLGRLQEEQREPEPDTQELYEKIIE